MNVDQTSFPSLSGPVVEFLLQEAQKLSGSIKPEDKGLARHDDGAPSQTGPRNGVVSIIDFEVSDAFALRPPLR
jgi:hypothetical protein